MNGCSVYMYCIQQGLCCMVCVFYYLKKIILLFTFIYQYYVNRIECLEKCHTKITITNLLIGTGFCFQLNRKLTKDFHLQHNSPNRFFLSICAQRIYYTYEYINVCVRVHACVYLTEEPQVFKESAEGLIQVG